MALICIIFHLNFLKMKKLIFLFLILMSACKKDEAPPAPSCDCTLIIANLEQHPYIVTFLNFPGAPASTTLQSGEVRTFTGVPSGENVTVKGDLQTPFAHDDFSEKVYCPGDCRTVAVYLQQ